MAYYNVSFAGYYVLFSVYTLKHIYIYMCCMCCFVGLVSRLEAHGIRFGVLYSYARRVCASILRNTWATTLSSYCSSSLVCTLPYNTWFRTPRTNNAHTQHFHIRFVCVISCTYYISVSPFISVWHTHCVRSQAESGWQRNAVGCRRCMCLRAALTTAVDRNERMLVCGLYATLFLGRACPRIVWWRIPESLTWWVRFEAAPSRQPRTTSRCVTLRCVRYERPVCCADRNEFERGAPPTHSFVFGNSAFSAFAEFNKCIKTCSRCNVENEVKLMGLDVSS